MPFKALAERTRDVRPDLGENASPLRYLKIRKFEDDTFEVGSVTIGIK